MPLTEWDTEYAGVIGLINATGKERKDKRTGTVAKSCGGVATYARGLPFLTIRDINIKWPIAETVWQMSGAETPEVMEKLGFKNWSKFPPRMFYGPRMRWLAGVDQLKEVANGLAKDPTKQGAVVTLWLPSDHGKSQTPCVSQIHFTIIEGRLYTSVLQRSCDVYFGLPHDMAFIGLMRAMLAAKLGVVAGEINFLIGNAHFYGNQEDNIKQVLHITRGEIGEMPMFRADMVKEDWWDRALLNNTDKSLALIYEMQHVFTAKYERVCGPKLKSPELVV